MSLFGRIAKEHVAQQQQQQQQQRAEPDARFGASVLQPFSVLWPFYERRAAFRTGDPPEYPSQEKIGRKTKGRERGRGNGRDAASHIFARAFGNLSQIVIAPAESSSFSKARYY